MTSGKQPEPGLVSAADPRAATADSDSALAKAYFDYALSGIVVTNHQLDILRANPAACSGLRGSAESPPHPPVPFPRRCRPAPRAGQAKCQQYQLPIFR